jgi:hypothetical protein
MWKSGTFGTILRGAFLAACCAAAYAQESKPDADEALDDLIEKLSDSSPSKPGTEPAPGAAKRKGEEAGKAGPSAQEGSKPAAGGEVAPQDQELDSLLEKLGESKDEPDAADSKRPPSSGGGSDKPDPSKSSRSRSDQLDQKDRELDERLEELTGRRKKKHPASDDEGSGPVSEIVKRMREIEGRLGKPDAGEETQRKQKQLIKQLETMIEQARQAGPSSSSRMKVRQVRQAGQKPGGSQTGREAGANSGGAPLAKPARPKNPKSLAGGKDVWGHLPPELRQEMENSFKEEALPDKIELIKRYYLSVSKNKPVREE